MACGKNFKVYLVGGFSAIGGFLFGYHIAVISGVLTMSDFKNMTCNYQPNKCIIEKTDDLNYINGTIIGILLFGCFVGSLIGGQTSDRFSRKYSIALFSFIFTMSAALQTASYYLFMILIGRFFAGISIGALSMIVPVYHSEIAETRVRGRIITLQQWAITIGIAVSFWINVATSTKDFQNTPRAWRIPLGVQIVPSLVLTIGIFFCPFSPRWLISHDREDEARDVLMQIRSASRDEIEQEMDRIKNEVAYLRENEIDSYRQLFHAPLLRPFLLGIGIQILQQLTGMNPLIYYAPEIFNKTSVFTNTHGLDPALLATGVNGCVNVIATIPTLIFIDKLGRRILLISGAIIMSISMLVVAIVTPSSLEKSMGSSLSSITIGFICFFVAGYAYSWGPIPWIYCTEIFPLTMRAKATSLTTAANWITNCAVSFLALALLKDNHNGMFLTFSITCAMMIGIVYFFYPETQNIHLEENNIGGRNQILVPQWAEDRRKNYNTFADQPIINQTHLPFPSEQSSLNRSTQTNNSDLPVQRDDYLHERNVHPNETVD